MRIIVYGAGAIGCTLGFYIMRQGIEVILIGRPKIVEMSRQSRLQIVTPSGTETLQLPIVEHPEDVNIRSGDIIFLCVKSQDTDKAVQDIFKISSELPIFCFQNGIRNEQIAGKYFKNVYGVMVLVAATNMNGKRVVIERDPPGWLIMGCYPYGTDEVVETVAEILRKASLSVMVTPDIMPYKWGKLMLNLSNVIDAITNTKDNEINSRIAEMARTEMKEILNTAGKHWISLEELKVTWPDIRIVPKARRKVDLPNSTWQSLVSRRDNIETDYINGEIVSVAKQLGLKAPINESLLNIARTMAKNGEIPGKYSPDELFQLINT
ncbi:ketopantoate reductase family protein [Chloroflexota bacterium]